MVVVGGFNACVRSTFNVEIKIRNMLQALLSFTWSIRGQSTHRTSEHPVLQAEAPEPRQSFGSWQRAGGTNGVGIIFNPVHTTVRYKCKLLHVSACL